VTDDMIAAAELAWENEGGRLRLAAPSGSDEGSNDNGAAHEPGRGDRIRPRPSLNGRSSSASWPAATDPKDH
jgi:hypothetical protein